MCWSFGASLFFALAGMIIAGYLIYKKEDKFLWIPVIYFALMELLQTVTYLYIGNCSLKENQLLTLLSYLHIAFQPFFINMFAMQFIPKQTRDKIAGFVYAACFIATILLLIKLYPLSWAGTCVAGVESYCGASLCSMYGSWHLAWFVPLNGLEFISLAYIISVFIFPIIYGAWKIALYALMAGPAVIFLIMNSPNEAPAVWCLFSVAILAIVLFSPLKKILQVKKWYFWNYPSKKKR